MVTYPCLVKLLMFLQVYGRHIASYKMATGAFKKEFGEGEELNLVMKTVDVCKPS